MILFLLAGWLAGGEFGARHPPMSGNDSVTVRVARGWGDVLTCTCTYAEGEGCVLADT